MYFITKFRHLLEMYTTHIGLRLRILTTYSHFELFIPDAFEIP